MNQTIFPYTNEDLQYLTERDAMLGNAIERIGHIERAVIPDIFEALINSIVGQQISTKAHQTVWKRILERIPRIDPHAMLAAGEDTLRACGLNGRKASYILSAASAVSSGELDLDSLHAMPDDEVIKKLVRLPGVGVWTAEMLLIFSLCRRNVFSTRDFGIRRGVSILYNAALPDEAMLERLRKAYSPLASVASLYLWEISSRIK